MFYISVYEADPLSLIGRNLPTMVKPPLKQQPLGLPLRGPLLRISSVSKENFGELVTDQMQL